RDESEILVGRAGAAAFGIEEVVGEFDVVAGQQRRQHHLDRRTDRRVAAVVGSGAGSLVEGVVGQAEEALDRAIGGAFAAVDAAALAALDLAVELGVGIVGHGVDDCGGRASEDGGFAAVGI